MELLYREMDIEDYNEVYKLWENTPGMGLSDADSKENIEKFLNRNRGFNFVCCYDNKIVATIMCGNDGRRGYLYHLAVIKEFRYKGIAKELIKMTLDKLDKDGIKKCHLFVFKKNDMGKAFWKKVGWKERQDIEIFSKDI